MKITSKDKSKIDAVVDDFINKLRVVFLEMDVKVNRPTKEVDLKIHGF